MQALNVRGRFNSIDYLSTVSGGGYAGACLSAAMCDVGGADFPFGGKVKDSRIISHIRNYSNYLLPRSESGFRNWSEAIALILRGIIANFVCIVAFFVLAVTLTVVTFPTLASLKDLNFIGRLPRGLNNSLVVLWDAIQEILKRPPTSNRMQHAWDSGLPHLFLSLTGIFALVITLLLWAVARSWPKFDNITNDTTSIFLKLSRWLILFVGISLTLDLQPFFIDHWLTWWATLKTPSVAFSFAGLGASATAVIGFASRLANFLEATKRSKRATTLVLRVAGKLAIWAAALPLPLALWLAYVATCRSLIADTGEAYMRGRGQLLVSVLIVSWGVMACFRANGYSLHRLYRDRLSKAFLVSPHRNSGLAERSVTREAAKRGDLPSLDQLQLSALRQSSGPYPIVNAALNVQGSREANRRGREADFFVLTPDWVGSRLTRYAPTKQMERLDSRLDLGTAMAISGAAASANMGGATIRALSPTLSLLNIRLGYYLPNPRWVTRENSLWYKIKTTWWKLEVRAFLILEMLNLLDEKKATVYLTDGGHIENLGIYELLRRRCDFIIAIDAEADPDIACGSLVKLERFARIDLGARIYLPWEQIRSASRAFRKGLEDGATSRALGPHAAIGKIHYKDGSEGTLLYIKASLTGDEPDYVLDYAERHPAFPHETTGDQFFSEEQFEMYRALGFHMVYRAFAPDSVAFDSRAFADKLAVCNEIERGLCIGPVLYSPGD